MADKEASERSIEDIEETLVQLAPKMAKALDLRRAGQDAKAEKLLREILLAEPRLAEPRLELAHMAALREDWEEAQEQAQEAVDLLSRGGQWNEDLPPEALMSFALNLLGEVLVRPLEEGDLLLQDREGFIAIWNRAATAFASAVELVPDSEDAKRNRARYRPIED